MRPNKFVQPVGGLREHTPALAPPPAQIPPEVLNAEFLRKIFGTPEQYAAMLDRRAAPVESAIWRAEAQKRARLDKKNAAQRLKTFKRKIAGLVREFNRLRETQQMKPVDHTTAIEMLQGPALEMFTKESARVEALQHVQHYWELVLRRENQGLDRGEKVTGADDQTITGHEGDGPKTGELS